MSNGQRPVDHLSGNREIRETRAELRKMPMKDCVDELQWSNTTCYPAINTMPSKSAEESISTIFETCVYFFPVKYLQISVEMLASTAQECFCVGRHDRLRTKSKRAKYLSIINFTWYTDKTQYYSNAHLLSNQLFSTVVSEIFPGCSMRLLRVIRTISASS